jgi:hypothetical protein
MPDLDPIRRRIDERAHVTEEFGSILDFVEYNGRTQLFEECVWVIANPSLNVGILKQHVPGFGEQLAEESRLSGTARSSDYHRREMPRRLLESIPQLSRDISHMSILRSYFKLINLDLWSYSIPTTILESLLHAILPLASTQACNCEK